MAACSQNGSSLSTANSSVGTATIKLGIAIPYSGAYAAFGEQLHRGATQAIADINAAGGINGVKVVAIKGDDSCNPEEAVEVAEIFVQQDNVDAVVGHFCSSSSISASEVYYESDILMLSPSSTNPDVTDRGLDMVMRVSGRDDQQGQIAGDYIIDELRAAKVVVIHDKDIYGQGLADATRAQLDKRGGIDIVLYDGLDRGQEDYSEIADKIYALNPDVIYFGGLDQEAGHLLRQIRERATDAWFISGAGIASKDFVKALGNNGFLTKTLMTFGADPRNANYNPYGAKLVQRFRDDGYEPEGYTLYAYAAVQVIAAAMRANPGEKSGRILADWLKSNSVLTVMGEKNFDSKGDLSVSDYVIYRWTERGTYEQL
ncbi:MAG: branched-chain amino acid ABC transporter substrate-binding protein [Gammaproteobacteria bacterium]|nr:branched-chain amino acid ABC transporter substrate-binding protein [Gammaproteobacteria bacterium]